MTNVNITNFRKNIYSLIEQTIKYNEPINVFTKDGNAILISEEDYRNIMETLYRVTVQLQKSKVRVGRYFLFLSDGLGGTAEGC